MSGLQKIPKNLNKYLIRYGVELTASMSEYLSKGTLPGVFLGSAVAALEVDFSKRGLSEIETGRVKTVIMVGVDKFIANINSSKKPTKIDPSTAEETVERIFTAARHESESRKIRYLGNLLGNIGFRPDITREMANHLVERANALSYTQLVLLNVFFGKLAQTVTEAERL